MNHQTKKFGFGKNEKLKSRKAIESLFSKGNRRKEYPVSAIFQLVENDDVPVKVGFSVPKRLIRKANQRNLIKRRMRESYRLNKHNLQPLIENNKQLQIMFVYMDSELTNYNIIESKLVLLLHKIAEFVEKEHSRVP